MTPLDRLPWRLQWFRGTVGSIVAHWGVAAVGSSLGHLLPWSWGAEVAALMIACAFGIREWMDWWVGTKDPDEAIGDMLGPVANLCYVLVL